MEQEGGSYFHYVNLPFLFSPYGQEGESTNLFMEDPFYGQVTLSWKCLHDWLSVLFASFGK